MFERLKKALLGGAPAAAAASPAAPAAASPQLTHDVVAWAAQQGLVLAPHDGPQLAFEGQSAGKPWRLDIGKPTRNYIHGEELRARAEMGLHEDIAVLVMNRPLKETLERKAYSMITDTLATKADPNLPEEMRWLSMFDEVGWDGLPKSFWATYAILADRREHALAWITPQLARMLLDWPPPAPARDNPFVLVLLRGKVYLRMQYAPAGAATVQHAALLFHNACEAAVGGFTGHVDV